MLGGFGVAATQFWHISGLPLVFVMPAAAMATEVANRLVTARVAKKVVRRMTSFIIDLTPYTNR